jgi:hypothetical protein
VAVTGFSAKLFNSVAGNYKSGEIVIRTIPGHAGHTLPHDPVDLFKYLQSCPGDGHAGPLGKGAHWSFTPEKIQDWFFVPPVLSPEDAKLEQRPFVAMAWYAPSSSGTIGSVLGLSATVRMNYELLTTDLSVTQLAPSCDMYRLVDLAITLLALASKCGENPDHMRKIATLASKVVRHPAFTSALKAAGAGLMGNIPAMLTNVVTGATQLL